MAFIQYLEIGLLVFMKFVLISSSALPGLGSESGGTIANSSTFATQFLRLNIRHGGSIGTTLLAVLALYLPLIIIVSLFLRTTTSDRSSPIFSLLICALLFSAPARPPASLLPHHLALLFFPPFPPSFLPLASESNNHYGQRDLGAKFRRSAERERATNG